MVVVVLGRLTHCNPYIRVLSWRFINLSRSYQEFTRTWERTLRPWAWKQIESETRKRSLKHGGNPNVLGEHNQLYLLYLYQHPWWSNSMQEGQTAWVPCRLGHGCRAVQHRSLVNLGGFKPCLRLDLITPQSTSSFFLLNFWFCHSGPQLSLNVHKFWHVHTGGLEHRISRHHEVLLNKMFSSNTYLWEKRNIMVKSYSQKTYSQLCS